MIHLDSSYVIDLMRERASQHEGPAGKLLDELEAEGLCISVHVACELYVGVELARMPSGERKVVEGLIGSLELVCPDDRFPSAYGRLLAEISRRDEEVSTMDLLIGTAAVVDEAPLVTRNAKDFERIPGLTVVSY